MDEKRVEIGDEVFVTFGYGGHNAFRGTVLGIPRATGDCWIIESIAIDDNFPVIVYIQQFETITLRQKASAK